MNFIKLNSEILKILDDYSTWFFRQDLNTLHIDNKGNSSKEAASSLDYLQEMMSKEMGKEKGQHAGPPEVVRNAHFGPGSRCSDTFKKRANELNNDLVTFLGAAFNAVHVFYPEDGYMGWHNNWDVPGWNILLNYNQGNGWFKHYDLDSNEIVTMEDPKNVWSAKVGYYGKDDLFWHCAGGGPRLTIGFVIPNEQMWEMMIEDIT